MTDKNAALKALDLLWCMVCEPRSAKESDLEAAYQIVKGQLSSPSPAVVVSRVRELLNQIIQNEGKSNRYWAKENCRVAKEAIEALATLPALREAWQPIESAPRDSRRVLVAYKKLDGEWFIREVWWRLPYEGAPNEQCYWCYGNNSPLLDASIHKGLGTTHWQPLPEPPKGEKT